MAARAMLKVYLGKHTSLGFTAALRQARREWRLCHIHRRELKEVSRFCQALPIRLNLGCGPNLKNGWVNIDLFYPEADLRLDLREPWPFPNNSTSYVYSEHVFEHFDFHVEVPHFLNEAFRVLESGGVFDVVVPDTEWPLRSYGDPASTYWTTSAKRWHPNWCQTHLDHINYHFRQDGEHKYAWDEETLVRTLTAAGFQSVVRREFNPTMDCEERRLGSLYVLARKC